MIYYFAYGSNLHPVRLQTRIPSAKVVDIWILQDHRLAFHKIGEDGSGKCNVVASTRQSVYGVVYAMDEKAKSVLDAIEGEGYEVAQLDWKGNPCFYYVARESFIDDSLAAYSWYWDLVWHGAKYHGFPQDYLQQMTNHSTVLDPQEARRRENDGLLDAMKCFSNIENTI